MTQYESFTAILGVLGFVLGLVNIILRIIDRRPKLLIDARDPSFFDAEIIVDTLPGMHESRIGTILNIPLEISNIAPLDNSVVSVTCSAVYNLRELSKDNRYIIGHRYLDLEHLYGLPDKRKMEEYWQYPAEQWNAMVPIHLPSGAHKTGYICYEMDTPNHDQSESVSLEIEIKDAFNKIYKKSFVAHWSLPVPKHSIPIEPIAPNV